MATACTSEVASPHLHSVLAAAEKGRVRRAAADVGVWESTVSRGIREPEDEIGVASFIRHSGGVGRTNAGTQERPVTPGGMPSQQTAGARPVAIPVGNATRHE